MGAMIRAHHWHVYAGTVGCLQDGDATFATRYEAERYAIAEAKLIKNEVVSGGKLLVREYIMHAASERAAGNRVSGVFSEEIAGGRVSDSVAFPCCLARLPQKSRIPRTQSVAFMES